MKMRNLEDAHASPGSPRGPLPPASAAASSSSSSATPGAMNPPPEKAVVLIAKPFGLALMEDAEGIYVHTVSSITLRECFNVYGHGVSCIL